MADSIFDVVAKRLQDTSGLDRLESRGTLRIALKNAGIDPETVTPHQISLTLRRTLPKELVARGVAQAHALCLETADSLARALPKGRSTPDRHSPQDVFRRVGRML